MTIRNPIEWTFDQFKMTAVAVGSTWRAVSGISEDLHAPMPAVRRIRIGDLREALARGFADFGACRTDVIFLCIIYPIVGLVLARVAVGNDMLPLLFPLASGFALVGPAAAVGLYELSRRREQSVDARWQDAFSVARSPSFGAILALGLLLVALFAAWMFAAQVIYDLTLGPEPPVSLTAFIHDALTTSAGWAMIVVGVGAGFIFAVVVLSIGAVSFPMLLDREVHLGTAVWTSVRATWANLVPMAAWGVIVAAGLVLGSIPLLLGLVFVIPVLGHATWHLYRKLVPR
ncbi:MAG TPA: DUF2189 domain-containing protein [Candidatus Cybelea sp.]|nr:DUF2189 domain-containing protein [Candidatus Cybelea sp.]